MTAKTRLGNEGYGVKRVGNFGSKTPGTAGGPHPVGVISRLALDGYGARRYSSFAGKTQTAAAPTDTIDPSLGARGGGATKKQLKKYLQNEERFQRRKRELDRVFETMGQPKKVASLKNTAELGGPELIVIDIDDDPDDMDIMVWAAQ